MYVQKEHVIKIFPNLLFRFGDDVIHQETIKCNITMNFKNKKQQYSIFSLKNRTVMSEHTKYRDNYEKKNVCLFTCLKANLSLRSQSVFTTKQQLIPFLSIIFILIRL